MIKLWTTLLVTSLSIVFGSYYLLGRIGLLVGIGLSSVLVLLVYLLGEKQILRVIKATPLEGHDPWGAARELKTLCQKLGVLMPEIYVAPKENPYSFSLGFAGSNGVIVLPKSLLQRLSINELKVVLAYHLVHLRHQESLFCGLSTLASHSLLLLGQRLDRLMIKYDRTLNSSFKFFRQISTALAAVISRASILPRTHHRYDREVCKIIGDTRLVANTLWKLHNLTESISDSDAFCSQHLLIVDPLTPSRTYPYFLSHPPVERRIQELTGHFPL